MPDRGTKSQFLQVNGGLEDLCSCCFQGMSLFPLSTRISHYALLTSIAPAKITLSKVWTQMLNLPLECISWSWSLKLSRSRHLILLNIQEEDAWGASLKYCRIMWIRIDTLDALPMLWVLKVMQLDFAWEGTQALNNISMSGG